MNFDLTHEQRMLVQTIRDFIVAELLPLEKEVEESGSLDPEKAREIQQKSMKLGLYALNVPESFGGAGLSTLDWMLAEEQFGHTSDILVRRAFGNVYDLLFKGTEEQVERWLLPSVLGERVFSIAFTEPEAGSDVAAIRTRAERSSTGWTINVKSISFQMVSIRISSSSLPKLILMQDTRVYLPSSSTRRALDC